MALAKAGIDFLTRAGVGKDHGCSLLGMGLDAEWRR